MLLIFPPLAKPGEPPAGIARLAGALQAHNIPCQTLDANIEGLLWLLDQPVPANMATDTWTRRAEQHQQTHREKLCSPLPYQRPAQYERAVRDLNRALEQRAQALDPHIRLSLAQYEDRQYSPVKSQDLLACAKKYRENIFFPWFSERLDALIKENQPMSIGLSLNYLSQALCTFAMLGYLKEQYPDLILLLGGGLVTSWMSHPEWNFPFVDLVDYCISGPGELPLLHLHGINSKQKSVKQGYFAQPDYSSLPLGGYLSPGLTLPYATSSGCYWKKCTFCPETAEQNTYTQAPFKIIDQQLTALHGIHPAEMIHFLDNALSPALLEHFTQTPPPAPWYGFTRISEQLADPSFCRKLRKAGCLMVKLGIESGSQYVLDAMGKGITVDLASRCLNSLFQAGIATYVYLLFGTPEESRIDAWDTLNFTVQHKKAIRYLNLAIFNLPLHSPEAHLLQTRSFSTGDLSLYNDFVHPLEPKGWGRKQVRQFLEKEFQSHPAIRPILHRDPPFFTSNHAAFFHKQV